MIGGADHNQVSGKLVGTTYRIGKNGGSLPIFCREHYYAWTDT